jgi:hypothetical protein
MEAKTYLEMEKSIIIIKYKCVQNGVNAETLLGKFLIGKSPYQSNALIYFNKFYLGIYFSVKLVLNALPPR